MNLNGILDKAKGYGALAKTVAEDLQGKATEKGLQAYGKALEYQEKVVEAHNVGVDNSKGKTTIVKAMVQEFTKDGIEFNPSTCSNAGLTFYMATQAAKDYASGTYDALKKEE
jgi:hypothetical protein